MGRRVDYTLYITNPGGSSVITDPVGVGNPRAGEPGWTEIRLGPRFNEVGHGSFTCAALPDLLNAVNTPGVRVVAEREDPAGGAPEVEMAGPVEMPEHGYQAARDGSDGPGVVTVNFADDLVRLQGRLVFPNPAQLFTAQTVARYTVAAGANLEDTARTLVNVNAGPGALVERRRPGLVLGTDHGFAVTVPAATSFARNTQLLDALRELSRLSGGLGMGYRIVPTANQLQFDCYLPRDLTGQVFFSREFGNIVEHVYAPDAPNTTVAYAGDATAGTGRVIRRRDNTAALAAGWLVEEEFVDARGAANTTELDQAADEQLVEDGPNARFTMVGKETPGQRYGYDVLIGDQVSGEPYEGVLVSALVRGADITVTPERGEDIQLIIGTVNDTVNDRKAAEIRRILRRIAQLEGAL